MARYDDLFVKVKDLYESNLPGKADWAYWLYPNHVVEVVNNAEKIAEGKGANIELSKVAALLHDIADYIIDRKDPDHEQKSLVTARSLMQEFGYNEDEISLVVDDAIKYHSCHGDLRPKSLEGLILATADSLAHLQSDFYFYATWAFGKEKTLESTREWALQKIERDINNKISFDDIREEARPDYKKIKEFFSRKSLTTS